MSAFNSADAYSYHQSSPLETLVRRASSRKVSGKGSAAQPLNLHSSDRLSAYDEPPTPSNEGASDEGAYIVPPRMQVQARNPPLSPLLHTEFRNSNATNATALDGLYAPAPRPPRLQDDDDASVYSNGSFARESTFSAYAAPPPRRFAGRDTVDDFSSFYSESQQPRDGPNGGGVPSVYVSDAIPEEDAEPSPQSDGAQGGRARSAVNGGMNFSRPNYGRTPSIPAPPRTPSPAAPLVPAMHAMSFSPAPSTPPQAYQSVTPQSLSPPRPSLPPRRSFDKEIVIERNLQRSASKSRQAPELVVTPSPSRNPSGSYAQPGRSPHGSWTDLSQGPPQSLYPPTRSPNGSQTNLAVQSPNGSQTNLAVQSPNTSQTNLSPRPSLSPRLPSQTLAPSSPGHASARGDGTSDGRTSPAASVYSNYSFYQLGSTPTTPDGPNPPSLAKQHDPNRSAPTVQAPRSPAPASKAPPGTPRTAEEFLSLGISHHEADRLPESAVAFERAATVNGGCGVGMLMYGLALRHGWGVPRDEKTAFKWLRRAAELATGELERRAADREAVKSELILAIYEVGQCFFQGWGVPKDQKMGVSYFQTAARLGDADAQQELAFCLVNGKGCKKDRKEAAKWYRAAVAQGASDVGLAWIYKSKFR